MVTKYQALTFGGIVPVKIVRETAECVFFPSGMRANKEAGNAAYFDTWADAKAWLVKQARDQVARQESRLDHALAKLETVKAMIEKTEA